MLVNSPALQNAAHTAPSRQPGIGPSREPRGEAATSRTSSFDRLIDIVAKDDPERANALREEEQRLRQAQAWLESNRDHVNEARKEAARQKIARLKAELQALRMLAKSNPEAAARRAAALARELAAAVQEYASASGGAGAAAMTPGVGGPVSTTAATPSQSAETTGAAAEAARASGSVSVPMDVNAPTAPGSAAGATDVTGAATASRDSGSGDSPEAQTAAIPGPAVTPEVDEMRRDAATRIKDDTFIREVREILAALKSIIKAAKQTLERDSDAYSQDVRDAETAVREANAALTAVSSGAAGPDPASAVNILV